MRSSGLIAAVRNTARRHPQLVALVGIFALYFLTRLLFIGRLPVFFDESIYIRWSQQALRGGNCLISMTDGKPPFHVWFMMPFVSIVKDPLVAGRLASVVAGAITTLGMFLIGRELRDWKLGALSAFLYVVCPFTLWYDRVAITEGLLLAVFVIAIYFAIKAARSLAAWWVALIGPAIGLAMITKGTAQLLFVIIPFAYLVRERRVPPDGRNRPLLRWGIIVLSSFVLALGLYSLLRFSSLYHLIGVRHAVTTKGVGEVLRNPFDVFFSNLSTMLSTLFIFVTPLLFLAAVGGLVYGLYRRWRPSYFLCIWVVAVALIESLIAKHWILDAILPRFFLCLLPPLLIGAGYLALEGVGAMTGARPRGRLLRVTAVVLLVVVLALPLHTDAMVLADPSNAVLPRPVRFQYLTDWPSGWGIKESADFVAGQSSKRVIVVGSNIEGIGLPTDGLKMYLHDNANVRIIPFSLTAEQLPEELVRASGEKPTYVVYNSFPGHESPPGDWPLVLLKKFPKDGNDSSNLYLYRVEP